MKKFLLSLVFIIILTGCGNFEIGNTPSRKVEDYLNKYQTLDKNVIDDLTTVVDNEGTIDSNEREEYIEFMKKHYQDLTYEIMDETIDGDNAIVVTQITVRDYSKVVNIVEKERDAIDGQKDAELISFSSYRLDELKKAKDTVTYTINFTLTKKDNKWVIEQPSNEDLNKINGLYSE